MRCRSGSVLLLHNPWCRLVITFSLALLSYALVCKCSKRKQYKQLSGIQDLLNFCMIICVKSKSGKFVLQNYCMLYWRCKQWVSKHFVMYDVRCRRDNVLLLHNPRCRLVITFLLALLLYALVCKCSKRKQYKQDTRFAHDDYLCKVKKRKVCFAKLLYVVLC